MATGGKSPRGRDRASREERERARLYQARVELHESQQRRRTRDNVIAGIVGGLLIAAVIGGQIAYYTLGPGAPVPVPGESPVPSLSPSPSVSSTDEPIPGPTETP